MTALQKSAWFQLAVVVLTLVTVAILIPILGRGALGGFGLLGLLGVAVVFLWSRDAGVTVDERDRQIDRRAMHYSFAGLLVGFLAACLSAPFVYGPTGAVPVFVIQVAAYSAFALVFLVRSLATLILYARS